MGKPRKNIIGARFGKLTVIEEDGSNNHNMICRCDCGKLCSVNRQGLISGGRKTCGCSRLTRGEAAHQKLRDLSAQYGTIPAKIMNGPPKNNKSGVRGVYFLEDRKRYTAFITLGGQRHYLGYFKTLHDAESARMEAEKTLFHPIIEEYQKTIHT